MPKCLVRPWSGRPVLTLESALSGLQASLLLIYFRDRPNRCSDCTKNGTKTAIRYVTLNFPDRSGAASLRHRRRAATTVVLCGQPYPFRGRAKARGSESIKWLFVIVYISWSNWNLKILVFEVRSKRRKTSRRKGENQQQTQTAIASTRTEFEPRRYPCCPDR